MPGAQSVAVIGGGAVGLATAYYLAKAGQHVVVVEARRVGSGASWGNAGWIVPSLAGPVPAKGLAAYTLKSLGKPDSPVYLRPRLDPSLARWAWRFWRNCNDHDHHEGLHETARLGANAHDLYDQLAEDGVEFEMWKNGLLFVSLDPVGAQEELAYLEALRPYGYKLPDDILRGDELRATEPFLSEAVGGGFVIEEERHVQPASLTRGLADAVVRLGGEVVEGAEVTSVAHRGGRVATVTTSAGTIEADQFVLAAGAWSTPLARLFGTRIPMQAGKGYSFSIAPEVLPSRPIYLGDCKVGVTPFEDGVRFAGTMEISGINTTIDQRRLRAIETGARKFVGAWPQQEPREPWAGMRPMAPDGQPIMGRLPQFTNAYVSTGHAMLGVTLALSSGVAMTEMILGGTTPEVLRPFDPSRFG